MGNDQLKVNFIEERKTSQSNISNRSTRRIESQALMEREWLENPDQFNPKRDTIQTDVLNTTLQAIDSIGSLQGIKAVDLGCGEGTITRYIADKGALVDAIDTSTKALDLLKRAPHTNITPIHDNLPDTNLPDTSYDLVVCADTIAYLHKNEYRWLMAEIARLVKPDGHVVVSTPFDINTEDPLEAFAALAETEFTIEKWYFNYDRLLIKILRFFDTPKFYWEMYKTPLKRDKEAKKRGWWFKANTLLPLAAVWNVISIITNPVSNLLRHSRSIMRLCGKLSNTLWQEEGISHALFIGKKRPITYPLPKNELPKELKGKRQVWE